jgi:hypothetical protein
MKAYLISVLALVIVSAVAGGILVSVNPSAADAFQSRHGTTRL